MEPVANSPQENEFKEWLAHPTTRRFMDWMRGKQDRLKERWAAGEFTDLHRYGAAMLNAKAVGCCEQIDAVLQVELSDLYEEMEHGRRPE